MSTILTQKSDITWLDIHMILYSIGSETQQKLENISKTNMLGTMNPYFADSKQKTLIYQKSFILVVQYM
jgi:hypothetical protein